MQALIDRTKLNPSEVSDIVVGSSQRGIECRMTAFYAGFPGIGAGLESMTIDKVVPGVPKARDCLLPMGITSENVAECYSVTRQEQDQAAVESHSGAATATATGKFKDEIVPVFTKIVDTKTGEEKPVTISVDDGIRPNTNMADLTKLKPTFKKNGTTTASGAVLMKRSLAMQKGLPILGVFRSFAAVGVDPAVMGIGAAVAIPAALKSAGICISVCILLQKKLGLDRGKVDVNGGAIALGHPLGATGSGMGAAAVFERGECADELCNAQVVKSNDLLPQDSQ
ncbi:hypothetical protein V6N12_009812 [Hibiscus sabdariffa]|uniref:Uncharacterized protein n=1 Tax=Hibiscus sabdariffa TaxID=183260 RepID=A0ABR2EBU7_9ROSI